MTFKSINPANNTLINEYHELSDLELNGKINSAGKCFYTWKDTSIEHKVSVLNKCKEVLLKRKSEFADLMVLEMGKPVREAVAEIEKCALVCSYYSENATKILSNEFLDSDASESYVSFEPLGVVLAVMPWNFPFWQVFRFAVPALLAGNTALLKHASNVSGCALAIEDIFRSSGLPEGGFQTILVSASRVDSIIGNPIVKAVTLTGSEGAGAAVASTAGKFIKKSVLELGGSDPFIVLNNADLDLASETAVKSRFINSGQSCIAAKRFIVAAEVYDKFIGKVCEHVTRLVVGDPANEKTEIGPLARVDLANTVIRQVEESVRAGASVVVGGKKLSENGAFVTPTVITNVTKGMPVFDEEVFGPVLAVCKSYSDDHAIKLANDTKYGLGASIWTKDVDKAREIARNIESGAVFINGLVKSDPRLPFGGIKMSGYGRELSYYGIREFMNIKTVWIK